MTLIPSISPTFLNFESHVLKTFVQEITKKQKRASLRKRHKAAKRSRYMGQTFCQRHYLETAILNLLEPEQRDHLHIFPSEQALSARYETAEFLSVLKQAHEQADENGRARIAGAFNSGFDNTLGMVPLAYEMHVASVLTRAMREVEFVEYGTTGQFDYRVRYNEDEVQVDCKVLAGDNGRATKVKETDTILNAIRPTLLQNMDAVRRKLLHIKKVSRPNSVADIPKAINELLGRLLAGEGPNNKNGVVEIALLPIEAELERILGVDESLSPEDLTALRQYPARHDPDWTGTVEWANAARLEKLEFAVIFSSSSQPNWSKTLRKVAEASLGGQLKGCSAPVLYVRCEDISEEEVRECWLNNAEEDPTRNPLAVIAAQLFSAVKTEKLCGICFQVRPTFSRSTIVDAFGRSQILGSYPVRTFSNSLHPQVDSLRKVLGWP